MSKEIIHVSTDVLKVHPRNAEFFDDIQGKDYEQFKQSISQDGILSPILVSPDMTVISGHQRLKACKELGVALVPIMIRDDLTDENEKLKLLLAANFGRTKNDDAKQRKIATEYVALCGNRHGGDRRSRVDNRPLISQAEIASQLGISETSLKEILLIERKLTPEIKELLDNGVFTKTTASKILTKLSADEQAELAQMLPQDAKLTQTDVSEYVEQIKSKDNQIAGYELRLQQMDAVKTENAELKDQLKNREVEIKEIYPDDYDQVKKDIKNYKESYDALHKDYKSKMEEYQAVKAQLNEIISSNASGKHQTQVVEDSIFFCARVDDFIKKVGGYAYLGDYISELPQNEKQNYIKAVELVKAWAENIIVSIKE